MSMQSYSSLMPMPIPTKSMTNFAPPPLPPPSHITDLEDGHDAGWLFANAKNPPGSAKLAPINPGSSLLGGHRRSEAVFKTDRMDLDDLDGRQSGLPVSTSPEAHIKIEPPPRMDEGFRNSITINPPESILKGERDFSRRSVKDSSVAYDQHLLSKIGKPVSPRQSISLGSEAKGAMPTLPIPSRNFGGLPSPGGSEGSTLDVRWPNSTHSGGVSPGSKVGWKDYLDYRSPSVESSAPSSAIEYDHSAFLRDVYRRRGGGTTPQSEETVSLPSRSTRGSYDQGIFSDIEGDFSTDDSLPSRYFHIREATPPYLDTSKSGIKRRASSPPREPMNEDRHALHVTTSNGDLSQRRTSGHPFTNNLSVNGTFSPSRGSLSAASSLSLRTSGSYSSATISLGESSMTSISTYDRPSPGGLSPNSDFEAFHDKSPVVSTSSGALPPRMDARTMQASNASSGNGGRRLSSQTTLSVPKPAAPKMGGLYICDCCPKKPKKFDSPTELRSHELEKQYSCQFCNNRFKNKNEAERHQNSLHLRRHSWSCAALLGYQSAFHPSSSSTAQANSGPSHDTCGYCGEEFPNYPQPDWDRRFEHLTSVHKFGECNNGKKFYRADHFRQHLKHSHAGTSGKWTNVLENACMKEEAPLDQNTTDSGGAGSTAPAMTGNLASNKISEVLSTC
ncbi:putative C2H2 finger domain protein [Aspergillus clavatus NRRL 1]|uniref:C2H2 finger domain protein, putative n=1 Tax=Aspergillus clavatus (strain ATCC 1007 / CBS 513.65 / DSM 816 / NCTC 3887 / NRRL 1 / QM 1276 / 107) TaxID=344612 RepID=A1CH19_ASPCL|nr:C2H2 finger domain protein, putative [Aspergillus clavatus NRRL 1]EAW10174.1 C2H2 finger domain protein, putative [Aspergillus clavatus NRRL 1]